MFRFTTTSFLLLCSAISIPQAAHAANFGFVRWPSFLDMPIVWTMVITGIMFAVAKTQMPKGAKDYISVPKEERSMLLKASTLLMFASLIACLGMVFVGMGLQRAVE